MKEELSPVRAASFFLFPPDVGPSSKQRGRSEQGRSLVPERAGHKNSHTISVPVEKDLSKRYMYSHTISVPVEKDLSKRYSHTISVPVEKDLPTFSWPQLNIHATVLGISIPLRKDAEERIRRCDRGRRHSWAHGRSETPREEGVRRIQNSLRGSFGSARRPPPEAHSRCRADSQQPRRRWSLLDLSRTAAGMATGPRSWPDRCRTNRRRPSCTFENIRRLQGVASQFVWQGRGRARAARLLDEDAQNRCP